MGQEAGEGARRQSEKRSRGRDGRRGPREDDPGGGGEGRGGTRKFPDNLAVFLEIPGEGFGAVAVAPLGRVGDAATRSSERHERCHELRRRGRSGPEKSEVAEREDGGIVARSTGREF